VASRNAQLLARLQLDEVDYEMMEHGCFPGVALCFNLVEKDNGIVAAFLHSKKSTMNKKQPSP
jgi:hypothetical protein